MPSRCASKLGLSTAGSQQTLWVLLLLGQREKLGFHPVDDPTASAANSE
jgi:hypothetical protein